jgi:hypothetical protein
MFGLSRVSMHCPKVGWEGGGIVDVGRGHDIQGQVSC